MNQFTFLPPRHVMEQIKQEAPEIDFSSVETCLQFVDTARQVRNALERFLAEFQISRGKFKILMLLFRHLDSGLSPYELAEMTDVTRATVTGLLNGLERQKLIERVSCSDDRRMRIIRLTENGQMFLREILPGTFGQLAEVMSGLQDFERVELSHLLSKVAQGATSLKS